MTALSIQASEPGNAVTNVQHPMYTCLLTQRCCSPGHELLPSGRELGWEKPWEVSLDETKNQNMTNRGERRNEDDGEGYKDEHIPCCAAQGLHLSGLQRLSCSDKHLLVSSYLPVGWVT